MKTYPLLLAASMAVSVMADEWPQYRGPHHTGARVVARPRQIAMFLSKSLTSKSLPEIGRKFGGRDHTTVIHAVKKIEELKLVDVQVADEVEILRRTLEA